MPAPSGFANYEASKYLIHGNLGVPRRGPKYPKSRVPLIGTDGVK
jgi:hypothetical protein